MQEMIEQVSNIGFPIVISIYLLVRVEGKLNLLAESINQLAQAVVRLQESVKP